MKFRKKPVVIEAVQLTEDIVEHYLFDKLKLPDGLILSLARYNPQNRTIEYAGFHIETLEGKMEAKVGDWIITGVNGEHYPCKPDIFEATYELVD